jgi:predicted anti-sigma-YlaC factor YlaD
MNHLSESLLNEFLDDELTKESRVAVETHVAECPECQASVEELRNLFAELKQLADELPSHNLSTLALTSLPRRGLSLWARLVLAVQAGLALGVLIVIFRYAWKYIIGIVHGLRPWEWYSHPISVKLPVIELSLPKLTAFKMPIPLPILIAMLVIVLAFWWLGNIRLLRDGNEYQI